MRETLIETARFYLRVLGMLLAIVGVVALVAMQAGWLAPPAADAGEPPLVEDAADLAVAVGEGRLLSSDLIPVDPERVYGVSARVRTLPLENGLPATARIGLGVAAFDAEGEPLRRGNANNRLTAAANAAVHSAQGWVTYRGLVTGESENDPHGFVPGTRLARVVLDVSANEEGVTLEVGDVRFYEAVTLAD